jgi:xenotropic and polytropic retrovirus receptor 1
MFSSFAQKTGGPPGGKDYPLDETSQALAAAEFNYWVENELHKIEEFYRQKENDAVNRMAALKAQLHAMRDQRLSDLARKREKKMLQESNDNVQNRPVSWMKSVQTLKESFSSKTPATTPLDERPRSPGMDSLQKITTAPAPFLIGDPKRDYMPGRVKPTNEVPYQTAKRKLKVAVVEYYRGLELLKSYCTHNREGFRKITKKFDKATGLRTSKKFMTERINKSYFGSSDVLEAMIASTEDLYARYFEKGSRKHAIERLRTREKSKLHYSSMFRSAFALGLSLFAGVSGLVLAVNQMRDEDDMEKKHEVEYLLQIWGGFFLPILFMHFFVMNCRAWAKNKINYVFIFEFDTRHNLDYRQLLEVRSRLLPKHQDNLELTLLYRFPPY